MFDILYKLYDLYTTELFPQLEIYIFGKRNNVEINSAAVLIL